MKLAYIIADRKQAGALAEMLVKERLAACCNVFDCNSVYWCEGKVEHAKECAIIAKTADRMEGKLIKRVLEFHNYSVPAVLIFDVEKGHAPYFEYVNKETGEKK